MSSEIRLTPTSHIVLGLLNEAGEATPYDLKQMVATTLGDFWSLPHAQLYAEPERLAEAGLLSERRERSGRRRKYYKLTDAGKRALESWLAEPTEEQTELRDPGLLKIFFGADPSAMAAVQLPVRRRKLEGYEELLGQIEGHVPEGMVLALRVGIAHEREWVRFWSAIQNGETPK
jgi:PadR family transcriptional regulator, regulatory protein AphA